MATQCINCGSELYAGQRFCRYCGKTSGQFDEESMPTQAMPHQPGPEPPRESARTAPQYRPDTNPVYTPPHVSTNYQPPVGPPAMRPPFYQPAPPSKGRSSWAWIIALVSFGLLGAMIVGIVFITRAVKRGSPPNNRTTAPSSIRAGEQSFEEKEVGGRTISSAGNTTVIKQNFPLTANSKLSLNIPSGEVNIEGWDQPYAEVKMTKSGGSSSDRLKPSIFYNDGGGNLAFRIDQSNARNVVVGVQIKLPRIIKEVSIEGASAELNLEGITGEVIARTKSGQVDLSDIKGPILAESQSGEITISGVEGNVTVNTTSGALNISDIKGNIDSNSVSGETEIREIIGTASVKSVSGGISATFLEVIPGKSLSFNSTSGDIDLVFSAPANLDLDARTLSGDINIDEDLGIDVQKRTPGQQASGSLGTGGQELKINNTSGDITIEIDGENSGGRDATKPPPAPESKPQDQAKGKSN